MVTEPLPNRLGVPAQTRVSYALLMNSDVANPTTAPEAPACEAGPSRTPHSALRIPELLAPAGDWDCARAAVENGADAIYFGLDKFNARMRAHNFTETDLP